MTRTPDVESEDVGGMGPQLGLKSYPSPSPGAPTVIPVGFLGTLPTYTDVAATSVIDSVNPGFQKLTSTDITTVTAILRHIETVINVRFSIFSTPGQALPVGGNWGQIPIS